MKAGDLSGRRTSPSAVLVLRALCDSALDSHQTPVTSVDLSLAVQHVWWKCNDCCCSHCEFTAGMLLTVLPWCSGCDRDHSGNDFRTWQQELKLSQGLFCSLNFSCSNGFSCHAYYLWLSATVLFMSAMFPVQNNNSQWKIGTRVPLWAPAEADDLIEVKNVSPGYLSLHPISLFMELDSSPLFYFSQ